jgi:hypothetical protein
MTADISATPARPRPVVLLRVAAVLATLLALFDVVGVLMYLDAPVPIVINIAIVVLAVLTVVGAVGAWLGRAWGAWLAAAARTLSIVPMIPVLTESGAPAEAVVPTVIQIVVTVVAVVLLVVGALRRRG